MLTFSQIVSKIDRACGTTTANYSLANKAIDINLAQNEGFHFALKNKGWDVDDFNHTKDPIITTNLVSGQRDYHFSLDEEGSLIIGISKIMVKDASGIYHELKPVNMQGESAPSTMIDGQDTGGVPTVYDKTANGIFLDLVPNYDSTKGLKIFIDREATYFVAGDTTKVSGLDPLCHDYLYLKPAYEYARDKGKRNVEKLFRDMTLARIKIDERYGLREKDIVRRMTPFNESNK